MSGSGGGGYKPPEGGGDNDCRIVRRESVTDPDPTVVATLRVNDRCLLQLEELPGGRARIDVLEPRAQHVVGVLFFRGYTRLIKCMRDGFAYVGIVQSVRGGWVELEIRNEQ
jgi:hypothetical protein